MKQNPKTRRSFALSSMALTAVALACLGLPVTAQDGLPKNAESFEVGGNKAFVYAAPMPAEGKPWLWYDLNTKLLKDRYEAGGGSIEVKVIPGKGHQVDPTFFACQELVDFVLKHAK